VWEAMHSGNIVVATNTPGPNELLTEKIGFLVEKMLMPLPSGLTCAGLSPDKAAAMRQAGGEFVSSFLEVQKRSSGTMQAMDVETID